MLENLSVKLVIGNRSYPMKVPMEDEQKIREIGKKLNNKITEIRTQMNIDDLQDILAMIAFKLAVEIEDKKSIPQVIKPILKSQIIVEMQ